MIPDGVPRGQVNKYLSAFNKNKKKTLKKYYAILVIIVIFSFCKPNFYRLPRWLSAKESACNAGDTGDVGSIPGQKDPLENVNPLQ